MLMWIVRRHNRTMSVSPFAVAYLSHEFVGAWPTYCRWQRCQFDIDRGNMHIECIHFMPQMSLHKMRIFFKEHKQTNILHKTFGGGYSNAKRFKCLWRTGAVILCTCAHIFIARTINPFYPKTWVLFGKDVDNPFTLLCTPRELKAWT